MKLRRFITLSSALICLSANAPVFAATIVVDNDFADCPQADFNSIQAAVAAAQPGDKILVCPGEYAESVVVNQNDLRIEAQAAPGEVVLQGTPAQDVGFRLLNTTGVLLQGFTVQGFRAANIRIESSSGNTSSGNTIRKNISTQLVGPLQSSIHVLNSSANVVEQNTAFANCPTCNGISVAGAGSTDNVVRHNETFLNGVAGVQTNGSGPRNVLFSNRSYSNAIGIRNIMGSNGNVIENNYVFLNVAGAGSPFVFGGIIIGASTDVIVRNNRTERNGAFGIRLQNGALNNLVEKNEVFENAEDGILLQGCVVNQIGVIICGAVATNTVQLNLIRRNHRDGIHVADELAAGNTIERNVIRESAPPPVGFDAHDESVGTGTGGTANIWINNKCETENRPELCKNPL